MGAHRFRPTDPRNGHGAKDEVVRRIPACAPCHKRNCDIHHEIMKKIQVSAVLEAVARRLASSADRKPA
jgi:ADP-heptose:LPS heptosyltransferase